MGERRAYPGDLTDDGQRHARDKAIGMLQEYSVRHGMRFFATVGNHDLFACAGRYWSSTKVTSSC